MGAECQPIRAGRRAVITQIAKHILNYDVTTRRGRPSSGDRRMKIGVGCGIPEVTDQHKIQFIEWRNSSRQRRTTGVAKLHAKQEESTTALEIKI